MIYQVKKPTNCPNCNAALSGSVCEYCGTRTGWDEGEVDFFPKRVTIPIYIGDKLIDEIVRVENG